MIRTVLAVLLGIIVAGLLIAGLEAAGHLVYPPPPGLDMHDHEAMRAYMDLAPVGALVSVMAAWAVGIAAGAWVAGRVARCNPFIPALVIGVLFEAVTIATLVALPHPLWFTIVAPCLILPAALLGGFRARRPAAV